MTATHSDVVNLDEATEEDLYSVWADSRDRAVRTASVRERDQHVGMMDRVADELWRRRDERDAERDRAELEEARARIAAYVPKPLPPKRPPFVPAVAGPDVAGRWRHR